MSFDELLKKMKLDYLGSLEEKIQFLENALQQKNIEELTTLFHQLKGSGKSYGVPSISEVGVLLESHIKTNPDATMRMVPQAISLLKQIRQQELAGQAFNLSNSHDFSCLKTLKK